MIVYNMISMINVINAALGIILNAHITHMNASAIVTILHANAKNHGFGRPSTFIADSFPGAKNFPVINILIIGTIPMVATATRNASISPPSGWIRLV